MENWMFTEEERLCKRNQEFWSDIEQRILESQRKREQKILESQRKREKKF